MFVRVHLEAGNENGKTTYQKGTLKGVWTFVDVLGVSAVV